MERVIGAAVAALLLTLGACSSSRSVDRNVPPPGTNSNAHLTLGSAGAASLAAGASSPLPGWLDDQVAEAIPALLKSCDVFNRRAPDSDMGIAGTAGDWQAVCRTAAMLPPRDPTAARRFFQDSFVAFAAGADGATEGLFTGYYEPTLRGSRVPSKRFATPLYRTPPEAGKRPMPSRAQIEAGALRKRGLELVYVDDPIDAFFLQIQGSGRVEMTDGSVMRVGYAGQNGHQYYAIGRELINRGIYTPETISMQAIRSWLLANPREAPALMRRNPSYVFFRELTQSGPVGAQGVVLTPGRSLAVDRSFIPLGLPIWLDIEHPANPYRRIRRLVIAQDTGGAIKGPVRGDLFWGPGPEAEQMAGVMKSRGTYYLLLPRSVAARRGAVS